MLPNQQAQIIVLANQKGGVGKTTTTVVLGHGMALRGLKALIVDLDPQGHAALALGLEPGPGIYNWIVSDRHPRDVIVPARQNLDLLPGDKATEQVSAHVTLLPFGREYILLNKLQPVLDQYDAVLIDCAPSRNNLHTSALAVADWLIVPTQLNTLDIHGLRLITELARELRAHVPGCHIELAGVLPTFYERRTNETRQVLQVLAENFRAHLWAPIPTDVKAREAPSFRQTLWEYAPQSRALTGFEVKNGGVKRVGGYTAALDNLLHLMGER